MTDSIDTAMEEVADGAQPRRTTKASKVTKLLLRNSGASIAEIMAITNWQAHSARAFLAGLRKKGLAVVRETRKDGETGYRLER